MYLTYKVDRNLRHLIQNPLTELAITGSRRQQYGRTVGVHVGHGLPCLAILAAAMCRLSGMSYGMMAMRRKTRLKPLRGKSFVVCTHSMSLTKQSSFRGSSALLTIASAATGLCVTMLWSRNSICRYTKQDDYSPCIQYLTTPTRSQCLLDRSKRTRRYLGLVMMGRHPPLFLVLIPM
jgi:hypothetical protein